jgi:salicylate---CoA ligase
MAESTAVPAPSPRPAAEHAPATAGPVAVSAIADGVVPWPDQLAGEYTARGWWRGLTLGAELWAVADRRADATALVDGPVRLSYAELTARADALASRLVDDLGLERGDRIVVQLPNCWEFVVLTLACLRAGVVPVMALPAHRHHELSYLVEHSEARALAVPGLLRGFDHQEMAAGLAAESATMRHLLVVDDDVRSGSTDLTALCAEPGSAVASGLRARWDGDQPGSRDVAVFLLSGGTTGLPKLIARTHDDYAYNARESAAVSGFDASTVYLVSLPASHNFPLACPGILGALLNGGRVVMLASPEPERAFATVQSEEVTVTAAVPAVAQRWLHHATEHGAAPLGTLQVLQVGGARLADEVARQIGPVLGCRLQQVFGMAEGLLNYTRLDDPDDVICTTQGRPMSPGDEVRLVDALDQDVPPGEPGSLLTRGPYTPRGYYRAPEQNARAFTGDGWYRSGDICRWTPDGNLVVEGRDKDMINRGGEKISAEEVENLVYRLPQVAQVAAVAMPDPELGERVCLYLVPKPGASITLAEVRDSMAAAGVARYKWPERLEVVPELLTTKVGKIDKKALREDVATRLVGGPPPR